MISRIRRLGLGLALALLLLPLSAQAADEVGALGPIVLFGHSDASADKFLQYHGRLVVGDSVGGYQEYRWGGASCGSKTLTDAHLAELMAGMNNPRILIQPLWKAGQGSAQCLVGYDLVLRSETGAL